MGMAGGVKTGLVVAEVLYPAIVDPYGFNPGGHRLFGSFRGILIGHRSWR
mgnify:CR=1 FL=1